MALRKKADQAEEKVVEKVEEVKEEEVKKEAPKKKEAKKEEAPKVEVKAEADKVPNVRIRPNRDIRTYIGDQWYNLKKGEVTTVPKNVKEILRKAQVLDTL